MLTPEVADTVSSILQTVVKNGTATRAAIPGVMVAGKTGTTEDYGDAWFVGWTKEYTVAVWVGYPDEFKPMKTEFQGEPVAGGTYPAAIWKTFMQALLKIDPLPKKDGGDGTGKPIRDPDAGRRHRRRRRRATVAPPTATTAPPATGRDGGGTAPQDTTPPATQDPPARRTRRQPTLPPPTRRRPIREPGPVRERPHRLRATAHGLVGRESKAAGEGGD